MDRAVKEIEAVGVEAAVVEVHQVSCHTKSTKSDLLLTSIHRSE